MTKRRAMTMAGVGFCLLTGVAWAEVFVYPKPRESQDQFQRDQFECHNWAQSQTGVNPMQPQPPMVAGPAPQSGRGLRGAAGGAALGAIGGAIGGDAGKGAAVGAGVGGVVGLSRQARNNQAAAETNQQAQATQQANLQRYDQAYSVCLSGRGYQVK